MAKFATVDEYIASFPEDVRSTLEAVRATMRDAAPGTEEGISYGIPTLKLEGKYVAYFSGWKEHLSVYPIPRGTRRSWRSWPPTGRARARSDSRIRGRSRSTSSRG